MSENKRKCTKCEITKDNEEFYGEKRSHCKECERESARIRMKKKDNKIKQAYRKSKEAAARYGVYDDLTLDDVYYVFSIAEGHCNYCGKDVGNEIQLEHIFSMASGGHNTLANVTTSCISCNQKKNIKPILTHIQTNSFDIELMNALVDRIAYRMDKHKGEVVDLMELQQHDFNKQNIKKIYERIKGS